MRIASCKQKLKQTIDQNIIVATDFDDFIRLMREAGYEIKIGKYISFRAEGQKRFMRSKTIGKNCTGENIRNTSRDAPLASTRCSLGDGEPFCYERC